MRSSFRTVLIGLLAGGAIAGGAYWFAGDLALALAAGGSWGAGLAVSSHLGRLYPAYTTGDSWTDRRWTQLSVVVTALGTLALYYAIPGAEEFRIGVLLVVGGIGWAAYVAGSMAVLERAEDRSTAPQSDPGSSPADAD